MGCPLGLNEVHCQNCYWLECKLKVIKAIEEYKDSHGNINIPSQQWDGLVQAAYRTSRG